MLDGRNSGAGALDERMAVARIADRRSEHIGDAHRAVFEQKLHPRVESARHAGREQAGAGHHVEPETAVMRYRCAGRRRALTAHHLGPSTAHVVKNDRNVSPRAVEMRLDDLQRECRRDRRVEGVAALLQHRHADCGRNPMRRRHDAERALDLRTGGKETGIDIGHAGFPSLFAQRTSRRCECRLRRCDATRSVE